MKDDLHNFSIEIANKLGETESSSWMMLRNIVFALGKDDVQQLLEKTFEIEAAGGMYLEECQRKRTTGGVFFYLVKQRLSSEQLKQIFSFANRPRRRKNNKKAAAARERYLQSIWERRATLLSPLLAEPGEVSNVKITLIGRPGTLEKRKELVITTMQHLGKTPGLPRGVPPLPAPTLYTVYIGAKQWQKVEEAIQNPNDMLIVEGVRGFDPELGAMSVHATSVSTKQLDAAKRQKQQAAQNNSQAAPAAAPSSSSETVPSAAPEPVQEQPPKAGKTKPMPELVMPEGVPIAAQVKIRELHSAATQFRKKLIELEKKPADKRFGYEMTQKLLTNTEKQLDDLLRQYSS